MHTYFVSNGSAIKIGKAEDVDRRLKQLQTSSAIKLRLLFAIDKDCEKEMHRHFSSFRTSGEWFTPPKELFEFLHAAHNGLNTYAVIAKMCSVFKFYREDYSTLTSDNLTCPICKSEYQHPRETVSTTDRIRVLFDCEYGHSWSLCISEYRGHGVIGVGPVTLEEWNQRWHSL